MLPLARPSKSGHAFPRLRHRKFVAALQIDPELRCGAEGLTKQPSGLRRYPALTTDDLVDSLHRDTDVLRELDLGDAKGRQKLLKEDLTGMSWNSVLRDHDANLQVSGVVVDDLDLVGIAALPAKHDAPLVIDANTMKSGVVSS